MTPDPILPAAVDPAPFFEGLEHRFGLPRAAFDGYRLVRTSRKYVRLVPDDHAPPAVPLASSGLIFLRTTGRVPKLTTAAARVFGVHATRNVVELGERAARAYAAKQPVRLAPGTCLDCTRGHVLVRHRGLTLGVGLFEPTGADRPAAGGTLESQFPKTFALSS